MASFWILIIFSTTYTVQHGRLCVTAQSLTDLELYQPTEKISVDICDSAPLQCCIFNYGKGKIFWFKQEKRKAPVFIAGPFNHDGVTFYSEYQSSRFQIEKHGNCFVLTILNTTLSDEATYYCAVMISAGTYLQIETSKPALCDNSSVTSEATLHGNTTNINTQDKTVSEMTRSLHLSVLGLGTALGLCALLIFCLTYFMLRRRKCENCRRIASVENSGPRQESEVETEVNYAALKFSKQKTKTEKRNSGSSDECVYSGVKKTAI